MRDLALRRSVVEIVGTTDRKAIVYRFAYSE